MSDDADYETVRARLADASASPDRYREEMWQAVSHSWSEQAAHRRRMRAVGAWGGAVFAVAGVLALGVYIGRATTGDDSPQIAEASAPAQSERFVRLPTAYRLALDTHLRDAETLLVLFAAAQDGDEELARSARDLAGRTRLLADSRLGDSPEIRSVLLDLELLLVQIARLVDDHDALEREVVRESVEDSTVLPRLQQLRPPSAAPIGIEL